MSFLNNYIKFGPFQIGPKKFDTSFLENEQITKYN